MRPVWRCYKYPRKNSHNILISQFSICICTDRRNALALRSFRSVIIIIKENSQKFAKCTDIHSQDNWPYTPTKLYHIYHIAYSICLARFACWLRFQSHDVIVRVQHVSLLMGRTDYSKSLNGIILMICHTSTRYLNCLEVNLYSESFYSISGKIIKVSHAICDALNLDCFLVYSNIWYLDCLVHCLRELSSCRNAHLFISFYQFNAIWFIVYTSMLW